MDFRGGKSRSHKVSEALAVTAEVHHRVAAPGGLGVGSLTGSGVVSAGRRLVSITCSQCQPNRAWAQELRLGGPVLPRGRRGPLAAAPPLPALPGF